MFKRYNLEDKEKVIELIKNISMYVIKLEKLLIDVLLKIVMYYKDVFGE